MTSAEAKRIVREKWPDAYAECHEGFDGRYAWVIWTTDAMVGSSCDEDDDAAWIDAAQRIRKESD